MANTYKAIKKLSTGPAKTKAQKYHKKLAKKAVHKANKTQSNWMALVKAQNKKPGSAKKK